MSANTQLRNTSALLATPALESTNSIKPDTISVSNVPLGWSLDDLEKELQHLFRASAVVHGLARNHLENLTATVTFPTLVNRYLKEMVDMSKGSEKSLRGTHNLIYDMEFMQITPLYEHREPLVEWV